MCQLIIVDTKDDILNQVLMETMLSLDSLTDSDGFGIVNEDNKMFKSGEIAIEFFNTEGNREKLNQFLNNNYRGIGHCRKATYKGTVNQRNAHPFIRDGITLMHNGSLTNYKWSREILDIVNKATDNKPYDIIDTERVALIMSSMVSRSQGVFNSRTIEETMKYFNGAFNFLINVESDPHTVHVVKGVERPLNAVQFKDGRGTPVGFILNSRIPQLRLAVNLVTKMRGWAPSFYNLEDRTHYSYDYGGYKLFAEGSFAYVVDKKDEVKPVVNTPTPKPVVKPSGPVLEDNVVGIFKTASEIYNLVIKAGISTGELDVMMVQVFNMSLIEIDENMVLCVKRMLELLFSKRASKFQEYHDKVRGQGSNYSFSASKVAKGYIANDITFPCNLR